MRKERVRQIKSDLQASLGMSIEPAVLRGEKRKHTRAGFMASQKPKLLQSRRQQRIAAAKAA